MRCVSVHSVVLALLAALVCHQHVAFSAQYLNNRPYPTYSLEHMPDTSFSCRDKVLGGYYADSETQCQMFHICVKVAGLGVQDFRFLCPNGTAFDQDHQICAEWDDVDCEAATLYYSSDNFDLYRLGSGFETVPFAGEDEGTFHLQRSETGDARLSREHQSARVNQQTDYNTALPPKRPNSFQQHRDRDRDILRASSSSNFFNNRNGGKETDEDYYDAGAPNQNSEVPKKKVVRKFNNRKPVEENYEQAQTQKPQRPTGFVNNFAGSIRPSSTTTTTQKPTANNNYEQYPERRPNGRTRGGERQYNNADSFRNNNQYTVSTPAPFKTPENNNNNNNNKQYKNSNRPTTQYDNGQYNPTTNIPKSTYNNQYQSKQTENYPSTPAGFKQTENYPTTISSNKQNYNNQYQTKQTDNYPSTPVLNYSNNYSPKQTENYPSTSSPFKQSTQLKKETENYPNTAGFTNQNYNKQYDVPKKTTQFKQTDNYPTTFSPNKQFYQKQTTQYYQKETETYPQNTGFVNTKTQQYSSTNRPSTQHTQYTPTVPKQTTQYQYSSTTPRFSKQFDGTNYDDGSYNPKYDDEKYKADDEFLKTAHSQNFASARNELLNSPKGGSTTITTQSPRPFSLTTPIAKVTSVSRQTPPASKSTQYVEKQSTNYKKEEPQQPTTKKEKDVSYDYAYYDTNIGSEPDYDVGTDFQKSTKKTN